MLIFNKEFAKYDMKEFSGSLLSASESLEILNSRNFIGSDYTGWMNKDYPSQKLLSEISSVGDYIKKNCDILLVLGIGGSYLGAEAAIEYFFGRYYNNFIKPNIYFLGNNLSSDYIKSILSLCEGKEIITLVISKSGQTIETSIAFSIVKEYLAKRYNNRVNERIIACTDSKKGILRKMVEENHYKSFVIPSDIGGRYSIFTPVGLIPIHVAGINIFDLISNYSKSLNYYLSDKKNNAAIEYAAIRNYLFKKGKVNEILINYDPNLNSLGRWWQQLFGESQGKNRTGIFPSVLSFSTDLHSMGQYIQQGNPILFETIIWCENSNYNIEMVNSNNQDGLAYLNGKNLQYINEMAYKGTLKAHTEEDVPNLIITIPSKTAESFSDLIAFFFVSCSIGGLMMKVNPFDQPGVEMYKKNMYKLLGKE